VGGFAQRCRVRGEAMRGKIRSTQISRKLRVNQTDAETKLWNRIRNRQIGGFKFVRQEPIGRYICDFVCREPRIVVEVDGGQHLEAKRDEVRDLYLIEQGYRVMRFWNNDVLSNIDGVLMMLDAALRENEGESG
jgi:very-short-patch-repair endonuclease